MMKRQRNISWVRLMMVTSQFLLALFLGYWLYTQFTDHKRLLREDIERRLRQSEQQLIDSTLAIHLINPILNDTANVSVLLYDSLNTDSNKMIRTSTADHDTSSQLIMHFVGKDGDLSQLPGPSAIQKFEISLTDSIHHPDSAKLSVYTIKDTSKQLLFKSVQLFITTAEKLTTEDGWWSRFIYSNPDTLMLKKLFGNILAKDYDGFSVEWLSLDAEKAGEKGPSGIYLPSLMFKDPYGIMINRYQVYLLKSISPQVIFAFLLLLITAMAFRMAYISLKNQQKLITIKNDFISNISHELKTPVSTVKVALEALLDFDMKKDPGLSREYLEMAFSEMNRLDLLVNQVLNTSVLENGSTFVFPEKTNLTDLVNEVLHSMQSRFDSLGAEIEFQQEKGNVMVNVDKLHIHGVLVNLIDNSLKYCQSVPKILIHLAQDNESVKLSITDNGTGIPEEYLDKVFDKFFRVPTGGRHNVKGYGLGLNYAALIMRHHGGTIAVKNIKEGGCRFTLSFPNIES